MKTKFKTTHEYIAPVHADDEYTYEPTHCSIEINPRILWEIFKLLTIGWLVRKLSRDVSEMRFHFTEMEWLNAKYSDADTDAPEGIVTIEESLSAFDDTPESFWLSGMELEAFSNGGFRFHCYEKHGVSFYSDEISFKDLLRREYFSWA